MFCAQDLPCPLPPKRSSRRCCGPGLLLLLLLHQRNQQPNYQGRPLPQFQPMQQHHIRYLGGTAIAMCVFALPLVAARLWHTPFL
jgi:hypothetical protein